MKVKDSEKFKSQEINTNASKFTVDWGKMEITIEIVKDSRQT